MGYKIEDCVCVVCCIERDVICMCWGQLWYVFTAVVTVRVCLQI